MKHFIFRAGNPPMHLSELTPGSWFVIDAHRQSWFCQIAHPPKSILDSHDVHWQVFVNMPESLDDKYASRGTAGYIEADFYVEKADARRDDIVDKAIHCWVTGLRYPTLWERFRFWLVHDELDSGRVYDSGPSEQ